MAKVELEAYEKHQQDEPDLTEDRKDLRHRRIENSVEQHWKHSAKKRWPEYQPRSDPATHERLPDSTEQPAKNSRRSNDHDQLQNNNQQNVFAMAIRGGHRSRSLPRRESGRLPPYSDPVF